MKFGLIMATDLSAPDLNAFAPIGLGCITASINEQLPDVEVILKETPEALISEKPDVIGISSTTEYYHIAIKWAAQFKEQTESPIIIGGIHISLLPQSMTDHFDIAVIGEGDVTIVELLKSLIKNKKTNYEDLKNIPGLFFKKNDIPFHTPQRRLIQDLNTLPRINWKILPFYREHQAHIVSARGCPYKCSFCASEKFARQHRYYSAEKIVDEIEYFVVEKGLGGITFYDDLLIANKNRLTSLIDEMKKRDLLGKCRFHCQVRANLVTEEICDLMAELNIFTTGIGIESFSNKILRYYNKTGITDEVNQRAIDLLSKTGIRVNPSIIFGAPDESKDDMLITLRAIYKNFEEGKLTSPAWTLLRPYPGTVIWDYAEQKGIVDPNMDWSKFADWGSFDLYLNEHLSENAFNDLIHEWQTKISLLTFDRIGSIGGNFIFHNREDIYNGAINLTKAAERYIPDKTKDEQLSSLTISNDGSKIFIEGWYEKEAMGGRWINKTAKCILRTRRSDQIIFKGYIPPKIFKDHYDGQFEINFFHENNLIYSKQCPLNDYPDGAITLQIEVPEAEVLLLTISSDKSFIPEEIDESSSDTRELSIVVSELRSPN